MQTCINVYPWANECTHPGLAIKDEMEKEKRLVRVFPKHVIFQPCWDLHGNIHYSQTDGL